MRRMRYATRIAVHFKGPYTAPCGRVRGLSRHLSNSANVAVRHAQQLAGLSLVDRSHVHGSLGGDDPSYAIVQPAADGGRWTRSSASTRSVRPINSSCSSGLLSEPTIEALGKAVT